MAKVLDVLRVLDTIAPPRWALPFDKVGLQVGSQGATVSKAVVSLDRSLAAVAYAEKVGAQLLLAHHPLIFNPIESVTNTTHVGQTVMRLAQNGIAFIAAHTNWDAAPEGVNDALATKFGLLNVRPFGEAAKVGSVKLVFGVPPEQAEACVDAATAAGAGVIGAYKRCAFSAHGYGTFEPQAGANPTIGAVGEREIVEEVRVEMNVRGDLANRAVKALRSAHPYEEPAIDLYPLRDASEMPLGRLGELPEPLTFRELAALADQVLATRSLAWGKPEKRVKTLAVVGGSADGDWIDAQRAGADAFVTGEVRQHIAVESSEGGMPLLACGHFATEHPGAEALAAVMARHLPDVEWHVFVPAPGEGGRPL